MSVQQELTIEQVIRQDALAQARDMFRHDETLETTTHNVLLAAQSFAEFVKDDTIPFEVGS